MACKRMDFTKYKETWYNSTLKWRAHGTTKRTHYRNLELVGSSQFHQSKEQNKKENNNNTLKCWEIVGCHIKAGLHCKFYCMPWWCTGHEDHLLVFSSATSAQNLSTQKPKELGTSCNGATDSVYRSSADDQSMVNLKESNWLFHRHNSIKN